MCIYVCMVFPPLESGSLVKRAGSKKGDVGLAQKKLVLRKTKTTTKSKLHVHVHVHACISACIHLE